jgi:hypothetical protein
MYAARAGGVGRCLCDSGIDVHARCERLARRDNQVVALSLNRQRRTFGIGKHSATPKQARRALKQALERQRVRAADAQVEPVDVQLLGQVTSAAEWPKLLAYWERRYPADVTAWPRELEPGSHALNLWPLPAGRVGQAAGLGGDVRERQPKKMLSTPGMMVFDPEKPGSDPTTGLALTCASWLEDVGVNEFEALRLAPPVMEAWATGGRLISRVIVDFGLDWSLPAADGV